MNSDERILQVLENSACLSKGQLLGYIKHTLYPEELRAVELHLSGCPICNDALDGLELQANVDELLSSMVPPVLPAIAPKEKPKEKKEVAPVIKVEKTPAAPKAAEVPEPANSEAADVRRPFSWKRPLGIAAALAIGFSALWYFEFRPKDNNEIAANTEAETEVPATGSNAENRQIAAAPAMEQAKETALADAVKAKDSSIAKKEDKTKVRKDTISAAPVMAARQAVPEPAAAAERKEDTQARDKAEQMAAKAAVARSKEKEESPKKEELSDYENGLKLYKQNQYASALLYLKQAEGDENNPRHWDAVFYSALCNKYLGKDRRARKQFERIIKADGSYKKAAQKQLDEMKNKE